jgi:hypothetical protein
LRSAVAAVYDRRIPPIEAARAWLQRLLLNPMGTILQRPYSIGGRKYLDFEWDDAAVIDRRYR